jgi:hypothetical protein
MPVLLAPDDEAGLRVGLQPDQAVDDVDPGLLELLGPADVGLLVEAGPQLHHRRDLLALLGRPDERATIGLSSEVRYSVCLIPMHVGVERRPGSTNASTEVANES